MRNVNGLVGILMAMLLLVEARTVPAEDVRFDAALQNGIHAREALRQAHRFLVEWTARKDGNTALIQSGPDRDRWTVRGTAARLYPQMVLAASLTDRALLNGILRQTLRDEIRLTSRLMRLPDDFDLGADRFLHAALDTGRILRSASSYAADGLSPIVELTGQGIWMDRMQALVDDLLALASIHTPYADGPLLSGNAEINGNLLCALIRLAGWTGGPGYLEWARRIGDAYCLGILPRNGGLPARQWDFGRDRARDAALSLNGSSCPIIEGLVLLYAAEAALETDRAPIYRSAIARLLDVILARARTPDGLFYASIGPDGRGSYTVDRRGRSPAWPNIFASCLLFGQIAGDTTYTRPARDALAILPGIDRKTGGRQSGVTAENIPQLLSLVAHTVRSQTPGDALDFSARLGWMDGEIEGLLGTRPGAPSPRTESDGSSVARAALAYAWFKTAGVRAVPWRQDLVCGATAAGDTLFLSLRSDLPWQGRLFFDTPRHHAPSRLTGAHPFDFGFPEWFSIAPDAYYTIRISGAGGYATWAGSLLREGLRVGLQPEETRRIRIAKVRDLPFSNLADPSDSLRTESPEGRP